MPTVAEVQGAAADFVAKATQLAADAALVRAIVDGPATGGASIVDTGDQNIKTFARIIAEAPARLNAWKGTWSSATAYALGDLVRKPAGVWFAIRANTNVDPETQTDGPDWAQILVIAGTGDVNGPLSSTDGHLVLFNGATGKLLKSGGAISALALTFAAQAAAKDMRATLEITKRAGHGDSNQTIAADIRVAALTAALTAPRVWTLPAANALNPGEEIEFLDEVGGISATNTLTFQRAGADTINGLTAALLSSPRAGLRFRTDGLSKWSYPPAVQAVSSLPRGYIDGLELSNNATDADNDVDIAPGAARDASDTHDLRLISGLTKRLDSLWAQGNNQGGLLQSGNLAGTVTVSGTSVTGTATSFATDFKVGGVITTAGGQSRRISAIASSVSMTVENAFGSTETSVTYKRGGKAPNAFYHTHLIRRDADGITDAVFSTDPSSPADIPAGWSAYQRLIGLPVTDGAGVIRRFVQTANLVRWVTPVDLSFSAGQFGSTTSQALIVARGIKADARIRFTMVAGGSNGAYGYVSALDTEDLAPGAGRAQILNVAVASGVIALGTMEMMVVTNLLGEVRARILGTDISVSVTITSLGWSERRGVN